MWNGMRTMKRSSDLQVIAASYSGDCAASWWNLYSVNLNRELSMLV